MGECDRPEGCDRCKRAIFWRSDLKRTADICAPWLIACKPAPIVSRGDRGDPEQQALLADSLGLTLLVVLAVAYRRPSAPLNQIPLNPSPPSQLLLDSGRAPAPYRPANAPSAAIMASP